MLMTFFFVVVLNEKLYIKNACGQHQQQQGEQQSGLKKPGAKQERFILNKKLNMANASGQQQHHRQQQGEQQAGGMTLLERCLRACHKLPIGPRTLPETLQQLCQS